MRRQVSWIAALSSLLLLSGWCALAWWAFGWAAGLASLYHTAAAFSVGYVISVGQSLRREAREANERTLAIVGGKEVQLLRLKKDEFAEVLFNDGIRIGAEEAASRVEELGAAEVAAQLRQEVRAALPETDARFECWRRMREQEGA